MPNAVNGPLLHNVNMTCGLNEFSESAKIASTAGMISHETVIGESPLEGSKGQMASLFFLERIIEQNPRSQYVKLSLGEDAATGQQPRLGLGK